MRSRLIVMMFVSVELVLFVVMVVVMGVMKVNDEFR